MEVQENNGAALSPESSDWPGRWNHLQPTLERSGPLGRPDFTPGPQVRAVFAFEVI